MLGNSFKTYYQPNKYFDNCSFIFNNKDNYTLSVNCVQAGKGGLLFRNTLLKNTSGSKPKHPAFTFGCAYKPVCDTIYTQTKLICDCKYTRYGRLQAYMVENCVFDNMAVSGKSIDNQWNYFVDINNSSGTQPIGVSTGVKQSCSYICNAYEFADNIFTKAPNLS